MVQIIIHPRISLFLAPTIAASVFLVFLVSPCFSTSRIITAQNQGFQVSLKHIDSDGNFTKFELLQRGMRRGKQRLHQMLSLMSKSDSDSDSDSEIMEMETPVYPGNGEFLMELSIGTPPSSYSAIMDTGSDLIWTQCKSCKNCFDHHQSSDSPDFDPKKSSTFSSLPCFSKLCKSLPTSSCDGGNGCEYLYTYGDYSSTQGFMASETFKFGEVSVGNIVFGCGEDNQGSGFSQGGGLVGLGRGPLSLVSQLHLQKFSYCLTSIDDNKRSKLLMGSLETFSNLNNITTKSSITSNLLKNPSQPSFYYLDLEGITVGETLLSIKESTFRLKNDGSGGIIIDSGTTITYLEESAFDLVKKEFVSQMKLPVDNSSSVGLELCFSLDSGTDNIQVPKMKFHFKGGGDLELPAENYIIADSGIGLACLAMGSSNGMSIFGNVQQQNMLVIHDLQKQTISFVPTDCSQL